MAFAITKKRLARFIWGNQPPQSLPRWKLISRAAPIVLILALIICSLATYGALNGYLSDHGGLVMWLLNADLIILMILGILLTRRVVSIWSGRKRGLTGSHLHVRLVYTFSLLAAVPVIIMTVMSAFLFHYGVQSWFNERVQGAITNSSAVAQAYLEEHKQSIAADTQLMAQDLRLWQNAHMNAPQDQLERFLQQSSFLRDLPEVVVFDTDGKVYGRSGLTHSLEEQAIPTYALKTAHEGELVILTNQGDDRVRALMMLDDKRKQYLYVGRLIDPQVLSYLQATEAASTDYKNLQGDYDQLKITVILIFVAVALMILLLAIWLGLVLARQLIQPISALLEATDQLRAGDFKARLPESASLEEFAHLAQGFNKMTEHIQTQRAELLSANAQLDQRRRLNAAVLRGVRSAIVGVNETGDIIFVNDVARALLAPLLADKDPIGLSLKSIFPDTAKQLKKAYKAPDQIMQSEIHVTHPEKGRRSLLQRIAIAVHKDQEIGAVITLEDITDLQRAQKNAAWADVAQRIAHEIKNPLTPIQLSAERLHRKYAHQITDKKDIYIQCIETILRHVEDIGYMVNEFSSFARLPEPQMQKGQDLTALIEESLFSQKQAFPKIEFALNNQAGKRAMKFAFDPQQMRQVFTNILKNAAQSVADAQPKEGLMAVHVLSLYDKENGLRIIISDSGAGFSPDHTPDQLLEPYMTLKQEGSGLGLAIVKKILDDHNADIILGAPEWLSDHEAWQPLGGATVILTFKR